jgi:hypothetical protein
MPNSGIIRSDTSETYKRGGFFESVPFGLEKSDGGGGFQRGTLKNPDKIYK